jgi:type IV pilus assembly protein PilM
MSLASMFRAPTVGLDIGSGGVKAVALRQTRRGWKLIGTADASIGSDADASEAAPHEVSAAVRDALDGLRLPRARVAAALSGHVIVKRLSLPAMSRAELAEAIPWEAEQHIPFDLADVQLDYQVIRPGTRAAKSTLDVLLVAARKDRVDDRVALITQAGRRAVVLDIAAFALANAYQMNYPERTDALSALIHVGRETTIACLLEQGQVAFTRDISIAGRLYTDALQRELGVDAATASRLQRGQTPDEIDRDEAARVLRDTSKQLVLEIRKTIDFYRATTPAEHLERIVLSGGACAAEGLTDLLATEFDSTIEVLDPFRRIVHRKNAGGAEALGAGYAVAVGLAMRREGDR